MDYDFEIGGQETLYDGYFKVSRFRVRHRRYDGRWSRPLDRELFERAPAVAVLPYDPVRDAIVLIEQFRVGALGTLDKPWVLEVIAGVTEKGESFDEVARREAEEEAGLRLGRMEPIADYLATPGGCNELTVLRCGEADLSEVPTVAGLACEDEDIRVMRLAFREVPLLLESGRIQTAPALVGLQWLLLHRDRIRALWRS